MIDISIRRAIDSNHPALWAWIKERHSIFTKKERELPKPWTDDKILQAFSFCNVHREDDRVTRWIERNWRTPLAKRGHEDLWFFMVIARLINWPDTLEVLGSHMGDDPQSWTWNFKQFVSIVQGRKAQGLKAFGGAYIVSTNGRTMDKAEYLAEYVLEPLWAHRAELRPTSTDTLDSFHKRLMRFDGMGSFMAAQVVADAKYTAPLRYAEDWDTWAASGPGSKRGLNRLCGRDKDTRWKESEWLEVLLYLKSYIDGYASNHGVPEIHAQDLQNCLCEFDKYERTRLGEGRPRATYPGAR